MSIPFPGSAVRGSKTGKPIMALLDLIGRTWSLGIVWQLHQRSLTFRELQAQCDGISPTLLNTRLKELRAVSIVIKSVNGYTLTLIGEELMAVIYPLGDWSLDWEKELAKMSVNEGRQLE